MEFTTVLSENEFINNNSFKVRYVRSDIESFFLHNHTFYEIFLTVKGNLLHTVNNTEQRLNEGNLLFIRDYDCHCYSDYSTEPFEFINLSFEKEALSDLFTFLGEGFKADALFSSKNPPSVTLLPNEREKLLYSLIELNSYKNPLEAKAKMRALLVNIFTKYFQNYSPVDSGIPLWLEITYEKMKNPSNFIAGIDRLSEISGKSREHIARSLKKYYNITPFEFISNLRMNYAATLMQTSNLSITEICYECGFSNLSWFYKLFENKYNTTPSKYKKAFKIHTPPTPNL